MKLSTVFVMGLEHSGTTLLDTLLSCHPEVLGLGEIYQVVDDKHRGKFFEMWGSYEDSDICSCGQKLAECTVWRALMEEIELEPGKSTFERYRALFAQVNGYRYVVDSSKTMPALKLHIEARGRGLVGDVKVLWIYKDPRSFAASQKSKGSGTAASLFRCFNWWSGANLATLRSLQQLDVDCLAVSYEALCFDTAKTVAAIFAFLDLNVEEKLMAGVLSGPKNRHVAIGNKDMVRGNSANIRYDSRWIDDWSIQAIYLTHWRAQKTLRKLRVLHSHLVQKKANRS